MSLFTDEELDMSAFAPIQISEEEIEDQDEGFVSTQEQERLSKETAQKDKDPSIEEEIPGKVDVDEDDEGTDDNASASTQPNAYSSFAKYLAEEGVLASFDLENDKIETAEDLKKFISEQIKQSEYSDLTEEQKQYLNAVRSGVDSQDYAQKQSVINQLKSVTPELLEENQELRRNLIAADFEGKGLTREKAQKLAQRSIDIGEDIEDAKEALQGLTLAEEAKMQQEIETKQTQAKANLEKQNEDLEKFKKFVYDSKEIIPGVKINNKIAEAVIKQALEPVEKLPNGTQVNAVYKARNEDPIGFEAKLNYLFYVTKGFSDFSKIATSQKSRATKELDDFVKGNTFSAKASDMGGNLDFTPSTLAGAFDESMINNMK
tara:strand:- start:513 stop:1640 length:1128 start_codon:yes stop_codon:yes gene_type:complete